VIQDKEGVFTLVAVVDLLQFKVPPGFPEEQISQTPIPISVFVNVKTAPGYSGEHTVQLHLQRPSGEVTTIIEPPAKAKPGGKFPGTAGGFNVVAQISVLAKEIGLHSIFMTIDEVEVARCVFTLRRMDGGSPN